MKFLFLLSIILLSACTKKYIKYPVIEKRTFAGDEHAPTNPPPMIKARKEVESFCEGQIFFNKNAHKITESSVLALVRQSCPGAEYLIDAKITKIWWTLLVYSRSCVEIESFCPQRRNR
jgi:hypothetical protein